MGLFSILKSLFGGQKFKVGAGSDNVDTESEKIVQPKKKKKSRSYRPKRLSVIDENVKKFDGKLKRKNYRRSK